MTGRDPLDDAALLLIDGNNLLHREAGAAGAGAVRGLLARLQALVRPPLRAVVVLDGHAARGSSTRQKVGPALELRHSGSRSADDLIVQLVGDEAAYARHRVVVVSDDRALGDRCRTLGAIVRRLDWLQGLLRPPGPSRPPAPSSPPRQPAHPASDAGAPEPDEDRAGWAPGRGATRKKGNPRRLPRRRGGPG